MKHLCEENLGTLLSVLFGEQNVSKQVRIKNNEFFCPLTFKIKPTVMIIDYVVEFKEKTYFVEFDGYRHFNDSKVQHRDKQLKEYCRNNNITYVSIPYFLQPELILFCSLFKIDYTELNPEFVDFENNSCFSNYVEENTKDIDWTYPNGFIDKKCLRPADFNIQGWNLFIKIYHFLMDIERFCIAKEVYNSLLITQDKYFSPVWVPFETIVDSESPLTFMKYYPT